MKNQIHQIEAFVEELGYDNDIDGDKLGSVIRSFSRLIREHKEQVKVPEIRRRILEHETKVNAVLMAFAKEVTGKEVYYDLVKEKFLTAVKDLKSFFDIDYNTLIQEKEASKSRSKLPNPQDLFTGKQKPGTIPYNIHIPEETERLFFLKEMEGIFVLSVPTTCFSDMLEEFELDLNLQYDNLMKIIFLEIKNRFKIEPTNIDFRGAVEQSCLKYWVEECGWNADEFINHHGAYNPNHVYSKLIDRLLSRFCLGGEIVLFDNRINDYVGEIELTTTKTRGYFHYGKYEIVNLYKIVV